jgi:hypothetical protein
VLKANYYNILCTGFTYKTLFIMHYAMKTYWRVSGYRLTISWTRYLLLVSNNNLHAPTVDPGERDPGTHWIGGWVGSRVGMDETAKWQFLTLTETPTPSRSPSLYMEWAIPALNLLSMFTKYNCSLFCQQHYSDKETDHLDDVVLKWNFGSGSNEPVSADTIKIKYEHVPS